MSDSSTSRFDISRSTARCWAKPSFGVDGLCGSFLRKEGRSTTNTMVSAPTAYTIHCIDSLAASKRIIHDLVGHILRHKCVFVIFGSQTILVPGTIVDDYAIAEREGLTLGH